MVSAWSPERKFGFDVETNGVPPWLPNSRVVGVSLAGLDADRGRPNAIYIPLAHRRGQNADAALLGDIIEFTRPRPLITYGASHETMWTRAKWSFRPRVVGDGYIAARLLGLLPHSLKDLTEEVLQRPMLRLSDVLPMGETDFSLADADNPLTTDYGCGDALAAWQVEGALYTRVAAAHMLHLYQLELTAAVVMGEQTLDGYLADVPALQRTLQEQHTATEVLGGRVFSTLGCKPFNLNSTAQVGRALEAVGVTSTTRTLSGNSSWSHDALEMIQYEHPAIPLLIEWKESRSLITSLERYPELATDGKVHPRWQSIGILGSSRMYAEKPSITSLPRVARSVLPAPDGHRWVQMVWDHPELRFTAALAKDAALVRVLAEEAFDDFDEAMYDATHLPALEPGGLDTLLTEFIAAGGFPLGPFEEMGKRLRAAFPQLAQFLVDTVHEAVETRMVTTWMNRRWRLTLDPASEPAQIARRACNAIGQQSTGTALKAVLCLLYVQQDMGAASVRNVTQVLPMFDRLSYCIPSDVPLDAHCDQVARFFGLDLGTFGGVHLPLIGRFWSGPTLGDLEVVT